MFPERNPFGGQLFFQESDNYATEKSVAQVIRWLVCNALAAHVIYSQVQVNDSHVWPKHKQKIGKCKEKK